MGVESEEVLEGMEFQKQKMKQRNKKLRNNGILGYLLIHWEFSQYVRIWKLGVPCLVMKVLSNLY